MNASSGNLPRVHASSNEKTEALENKGTITIFILITPFFVNKNREE